MTLVCTGEGATSEGEFWECMNAACLEKLPLLVLVEDNGFAISVPVETQTAGGSISALLRSFPGLFIAKCDGTDFLESFQAMSDAVSYCRSGRGPALVHARCTRPYSHSLSDDERLYKTAAERASEAARDPLVRYPEWLIREGILDRHALQSIIEEADEHLQQVTQRVLRAEPPENGTTLLYLYSDKVDPTSREFEAEPAFQG